MNGNCHFVFASSVATSVAIVGSKTGLLVDEQTITLLISTALIGGIFPDIDNPKSNMGQLSRPVSTLIEKLSKPFGKVGKNHRGVFHDPILYIAGLLFCFYNFTPLIGFFVGALSHLFLDMFNPSGIRVLGVKFLRIAKIPSSSKEGVVITWIMSILCILSSILYMYF